MDEILKRIPQRAPFLFIDKLLNPNLDAFQTSFTFHEDLYFFKGHFPGNPIVPGVILCEMAFQSGALLMSYKKEIKDQTAVVTRINQAKFRSMIKPGDVVTCEVNVTDEIAHAVFMNAKLSCNGKTCLQLEFSCALV